MLQITECNISLKLDLQKKAQAFTIERAWASTWEEKRSFATPFANWC